ncbi:hypothetical protein COH20_006832 [Aspergillus flavus]|uniref:Uncharacterized protein n=1 Tax=Aspergillus flavus TaxID=5059 RepID=A0AB74BPZ9_ASPFL|nr:hypothetical protein COH20_006832 [Aspergillus flavus]RMZ36708.1 hypothetical protein CA14_006247 [Aspergillus flavus]
MSNRQFLPYGLTNTIDHCLDIVASTICSSSSRMEIDWGIVGSLLASGNNPSKNGAGYSSNKEEADVELHFCLSMAVSKK